MPGNGNKDQHSMKMYEDLITVVDQPKILNDTLFLSYCSSSDEFIKICNQLPKKYLVCHATFEGAQFENGFYAKEGIDQKLIPHEKIISGHIHRRADLGKVSYIGSPRWRTVSDANQNKSLTVLDHESDFRLEIDTSVVCKPIYNFTDEELAPYIPTEAHKKASVTVDIHGLPEYIENRKNYFNELGFRVRTFPIKHYSSEIKESEGISTALDKFISNYKAKYGTGPEELRTQLASRLGFIK
jgi:hypothetical protein